MYLRKFTPLLIFTDIFSYYYTIYPGKIPQRNFNLLGNYSLDYKKGVNHRFVSHYILLILQLILAFSNFLPQISHNKNPFFHIFRLLNFL